MSDEISKLAARRAAAQRRYAKRQAELEEEQEERNASPNHVSTRDEMSGATLIGTAYDADESASSGAARLIRSSHDERRAINQLIYGRLNEIDTSEFKPQAFIGRRERERDRAAASSSSADIGHTAPSSTTRAAVVQRPEDFMDEEDRAELMATGNSKGTVRTAFKGLATAGAAADMIISPASDLNLTIKLLKGLGWRSNATTINSATSHKRKHEETKVYSASLPPGMILEGDNLRPSFDGDESVSDVQAYMQMMEEGGNEEKPQVFTAQRKDDTHGIGYKDFVSHLSMAQRAKYDLSASAPLTFVRAKQVTDANPLAKPKSYSIEVPDNFDGKHHFPPTESVKQRQFGQHVAVIEEWRGKMDSAQRGRMLGEPPSLPTAPPAQAAPVTDSSTTKSLSSSSAPASSSAVSSDAMEQHRLHLQKLEQQRLQRHQPQQQHQQHHHIPSLPLPPPPPPSQPAMVGSDGRINIQAVISAAAANAKSAMVARASRWGAAPPTLATTIQAPNPIAPAKQEYPLAEAFLQQMRADATAVPVDLPSTTAPPAPPASTFQIPPELSALFPKFVVGATMDEKGAVHETHDESSSSDAKVEGGILPPSQTSGEANSEIRLRVVQKKEPANEYEAAAQMKMFGKLTRKTEPWTPHNLLYKRFGLPAPSRLAQQSIVSATTMKGGPSSGKAVAGMPAFVESQVMFGSVPIAAGLSQTSAPSTTSNTSAASARAAAEQMAREEEEMIRADLLDDEDEDENNGNAPDESTMQDEGAEESSSEQKPSVDLFKAIFERTDAEEQQRRTRAKAKRIAEESLQRQKENTPTGPLFAAAAKSVQADPLLQVVQSLPTSTSKPAAAPTSSQSDTNRINRGSSAPSNREIISLDSDDDVEMLESNSKSSNKPSEQNFREIAARLTKGLEFTASSLSSQQDRKNSGKRARESNISASSGLPRQRGEEMDIYGGGGGASEEDDIGPHMASLSRNRPNASAKAQFVPPPMKEIQQKAFTAPPPAWPFATSFLPSSAAAAAGPTVATPTLASTASSSTSSTPNTLLAELLRLRKLKKQSKKEKKQKKEKKSKKDRKKKSSKSHKRQKSHDDLHSSSSSDESNDASSSDSSDASEKEKKQKKSSKH